MKRIVIENTGTEMRKYSFMVPLKETGALLGIAEIPYFETEGKETDKSRIAGQPSQA